MCLSSNEMEMTDTRAYEIIVGTEESQKRDRAIALASSRLAYGDHSDTFALGDLFEVTVYGDDDADQHIGVGLNVAIQGTRGTGGFESQLEALNSVESWERIHYERLE